MTYYAVVSALIFAVVAVGQVIRILNRWAVHVNFVVQRSGYERTVREKVKCVHAWVRDEIVQYPEGTCPHVS
jgi:hypothetical protein